MSMAPYKQIIEAALFVSSEPLDLEKLKQLVTDVDIDINVILQALEDDYQDRGIELVKVATGYRFQSKVMYAEALRPLYEKSSPRYSRALLETLALIVYQQPITRGEIEAVRGVSVNPKIIKILQERDWIKVVGQRDAPGKPALFATTKHFLDYFNLTSLNELPPLQKIVDLQAAEQQLTEQLMLAIHPAASSDVHEVPQLEVVSDPL